MDKLTTKFQAALADAQSLAVGRDNQYIDVHLMAALRQQQGGTARPLLEGRRSGRQIALGSRRALDRGESRGAGGGAAQ
jgi:ATP-dependent Clp protease ATP-binding subunit ClpB